MDLLPVGSPFSTFGVEMGTAFNPDVDWNYELTQPAPGSPQLTDFVAVALHEIGHGLGFESSVDASGNYADVGGFPSVYDTFAETVGSVPLVDLTPADRLAALSISGNIVFAGPNATIANADQPPTLLTVDDGYHRVSH
jgi:hypothetical protein